MTNIMYDYIFTRQEDTVTRPLKEAFLASKIVILD